MSHQASSKFTGGADSTYYDDCSNSPVQGTSSSSTLTAEMSVGAVAKNTTTDQVGDGLVVNFANGGIMDKNNPMENDVILQVFFSVCPKASLKVYRLVCKKWRDRSLSRWRQSAQLTLAEIFAQKGNSSGERLSFSEFRSLYQGDSLKLLSKPFQNFRLHQTLACLPPFDWFWPTIGPSMKSLSIDAVNIFNCFNFMKFYTWHVPNLEKLVITYQISDKAAGIMLRTKEFPFFIQFTNAIEHHMPSFPVAPHENLKELEFVLSGIQSGCLEKKWCWEPYFNRFHNVQKLKLSNVGSEEILLQIFRTILAMHADENGMFADETMPIKQLDVMNLCPTALSCNRWYNHLMLCRFPLERLDFSIGLFKDEGCSPLLKLLLESYSSTLKHLHLFRPPFFLPFQNFPIGVNMPHLKTLKLRGPIAGTFEFLRLMPNLTSLSVISGISIYEEHKEYHEKVMGILQVFNRTVLPLPPGIALYESRGLVENLQLDCLRNLETDYLFSADDFKVMTDWMPHVEDVTVQLTNKTFQLVCERWGNLRKLSILWNSSVDDLTFTGMKWEEALKYGEIQICLQTGEAFDDNGKLMEWRKRTPNITDLQKLTSLRLEPCIESSRLMSDHGILFGLVQSPRLKAVQVYAKSAMRDTRRALEMKIPNSFISTLEKRGSSPSKGLKIEVNDKEMTGKRICIKKL